MFYETESHWASAHGMNYEKKRATPLFSSVPITLWLQRSRYDLRNSTKKSAFADFYMVHQTRLELARVAPYAPQAYVSAIPPLVRA